jgi:hypothetical protein
VEIAKLQMMLDDGGKAGALQVLAENLEKAFDSQREMARFISILLVDRAVKELDGP